jgi:hypothetical protein
METSVASELLCISENGVEVYYDPIGSHAATHFDDTPYLKENVIELIQKSTLANDKEHFEYDFQKVAGKSDLLVTTEKDEIFYAKRLNRDNYTRFVLNRHAEDSSFITVVMYKHNTFYELYSAWVGQLVPSFPGAPTATLESISFWRQHALVWGTQKVQLGTETTVWPWN